MSRSLKVRQDYIGKVKLAVRRNGFLSQQALAEELGLARSTVVNFLTGKSVDRAIFEEICEKLSLDCTDIAELEPLCSSVINSTVEVATNRLGLAEAPDVATFYGRMQELARLEQWILHEKCRLVALLGVGGIGKTTLSVKLAHQIKDNFEYVIWRTLQNAPPVEEILAELIHFFSNQQEINLPDTVEGKVSRLLHYLRSFRCLVLLDNLESVLQGGISTGQYSQGYEGYGYLLKHIGEVNHQSCLILTSREKPKEVALLEGANLRVRSLLLPGLLLTDGYEIFAARSCFATNEQELQEVCRHYAGNPLALKIAAAAVQEVCGGSLGQLIPLLRQGKLQFDDINDLLEQQFNRLSSIEQQVMYWLAVNREPVSLQELEADFVFKTVTGHLLNALQSLARRAFIEQNAKQFVLQPVVLEYVTHRLIDRVCEDITSERQEFINDYTLIKAQSKEYIRLSQIRLILQPVIDKLVEMLGCVGNVERQLKHILTKIRQETPLKPGYTAGNILNILCEINTDISNLDCSYLTIWQAYLKGKSLQHVNFAYSNLAKSVFTETFGAALWVVFSPDGSQIASGGIDGEIRLWQVASCQQVFRWKAHTNWIRSVAFSPDGHTLATGSADCTVKLWDVITCQCLQTFQGHTSRVWSVAFSPVGEAFLEGEGCILASSSDDQTIRLWNLESGECLKVLQGHTGRIRSVIFSPDGQALVSGGDDKTIRLWDAKTGQCLNILHGHTSGVTTVALSPDAQTLASASADYTVKLWNINTGQCLTSLKGHISEVWSVSFSSDGQILASGSNDQTIKFWDVNTGQCLRTLQGHTKEVWSVSFSSDGQILASGSNDQTIKFWDVNTGQCLRTLQGYTNGVRSIGCSPDSQTIAVSSADNAVRLWNVNTGRCLRTLRGHTSQVWSVAFSPDGQTLASGSEDHTVRLWNVNTSECIKVLEGHTNWVWSVTFSPNGQTLATASDDYTVKLWSLSTSHCLKTLEGHTNWVWSVDFNMDGSILASSSNDQTVRLWDVQTGQCLKVLQGHTNGIRAVKFSPDGQTLASGSEDHTVKIWDASNGKCVKVLQGHTDWVWSVDFNTDGTILATSSNDQTIRLWDVRTGQCLKVLQGHTNWVRAVSFSANDRILISGSEDETTKLWDVETGQYITSFISPRPYEGMNITNTTGLTEAQKATLKALGAIELLMG
ncbi:hypothetical protein LC608_31380 [Nostoc sp. XA010]|uniref:WD40 domain-containing protein n=1 Tax=Nostoc sp. XA010 TaxID=2780407 RepID=UPI001E5C777F|nr:NB-ARC domain-containing protein [Nostoc sp. XA010]MCC5661378.1 hypothetical protein [Nostoc sp. XA010]